MTTTTKSIILLTFTLVVGFSLGLFADATLVRNRRDRIAGMRRPQGFVARMEQVIQPRDSAQADSLRPLLQQMADANSQVIRDANVRLRSQMDSLRILLSPKLDSGQRARLEREISRMPPVGMGGGPGGRGRRGGGRGFPPGGPPGEPPGGGPPPAGGRPPL